MNCSCLRGNFDFALETLNTDVILFTDLSDWMDKSDDEKYEIPDTYTVYVTTPKSSKQIPVDIKPNTVTAISAKDLNISFIDDGIYTFNVSKEGVGCGKNYTKFGGVDINLQSKLACILSNISDKDFDFESLSKATYYLDAFRVNAKNDQFGIASDYYTIAKDELSKFKCDC